ncbi:acyl-CoA dehydrogenase [Erythrobacter arachoides]|uniref:3-methylmercaptopropionyl-CoA dehydrogenase n=1 Tax=Aurantiacibacter arachoides TaxID=1850444 RepID=A0A845A1Z1_9SPHN|nr:acyl-CoA dehydrogenase C-terminal domain-containing protein [Aurantiacibacter arachoides]MXO93156.1 acyl-CoA dehydrogenase [Aurantiacibacter arachoides]GGD51614.1 acyl-CoA dehydrogenase [Aurantiacibacter arachoides]
MTGWTAPVRDTLFVLTEILGVPDQQALHGYDGLDATTLDALCEGMGRFCEDVIAPLNRVADAQGCTRHADGSVTTPQGFPEAYAMLVEAGWQTLTLPEQYGGQGMPHVLGTVFEEYMNSACPGFMMYPGILPGATSTVMAAGSEHLKDTYLPKMVSGEWLATMALTEAHAGTDLGLMRTRAEPRGNGTYAVTGEKIFISGGEHDLTANIVHLVLARLPDAPAGSRGISLFLVPKVLPDGERNTLACAGIEHKMGLNGSATCAMHFDGATGWLVGEANAGLGAMFIMMNAARLGVGVQGLANAEHAYQRAVSYATERMQGRAAGPRSDPDEAADSLLVHPDVRRMLMDARAFTEGFRALVLWTAMQIDRAHGGDAEADALVGFLTPVIKAYGTDRGFETAVAMQQVFGGHGYVKEWGIEQIVRDARIGMIYEGANGVQAMDLVNRKVLREGGKTARLFFDLVEKAAYEAPDGVRRPLRDSLEDARLTLAWFLAHAGEDPDNAGAGAYAFMQMIGVLATGWMWAKMARWAEGRDDDFARAKSITARHYAERALPETAVLRRRVEAGSENLMALPAEAFARS